VNPHIKEIYQLYNTSFQTLLAVPKPLDQESTTQLASKLSELVEHHHDVIPILAQGFAECGRYMSKPLATEFLDSMIHARIGIRVLAEHFLALQQDSDHYVGIVNTALEPAKLIHSVAEYVQEICQLNYGVAPEFFINGHTDTKLAYVTVHLEYILMEILKNSFRAIVEFAEKETKSLSTERLSADMLPPLEISIAQGENDVTVRLRDQGGGVDPSNLSKIWEYSWTSVKKDESDSYDTESVFGQQSQMGLQRGTGGPMQGLGFGVSISFPRIISNEILSSKIVTHVKDICQVLWRIFTFTLHPRTWL
jgi:signal transduction histidine kinase